MGTYEKKVNQLKDLMVRKYKSAYDKSKGIDIDISSIMYLPVPNEWAKRYGKVCCSIWQVCDHYINPNRKHNRKQTTYVRRPSNKACPNYEYGDDNFENRRRCIKEKNTR